MGQQEQILPNVTEGAIPEQRNGVVPARRGTQLRVDARRNLESVLRAAREVFGELGYGAPMEEVARRAGVGVGTVYRRFPSKEVLVHRIASEEVQWLTAQAREALTGDPQPWDALAGYLSRAVATGAGRLLPPEAFRHAELMDRAADQGTDSAADSGDAPVAASAVPTTVPGGPATGADVDPASLLDLLGLLAQLVEQARAAGELRGGVTVADVVLVLTASVPAQPNTAATGAGAGAPTDDAGDGSTTADAGAPGGTSARLLRILLDGLRAGV